MERQVNIEDIDEFVDQAELKRRSTRYKNLVSIERYKQYRAQHAEKFAEMAKRYRERNKEKLKERDRRRVERRGKSIRQLTREWMATHEEQSTVWWLKRQLEVCKLWQEHCPRGTVTPYKLKLILLKIMRRRAEDYLNPTDEKKKILCIVGESGSGKTLASLHLKYKIGANVICSFTTRPPRPTEEEGRDHHFIDIKPQEMDVLAMTEYGGYLYYALKTQVFGPCTVYVIDEDGLRDLMDVHGDEYRIFTVYLKRDLGLRRKCGIFKERWGRDLERKPFDMDFYDYVIENNSTKRHLFESIEKIYDEIKNMD